MRHDPTEFRERFNKWKSGELVYDKGRPITDNTLIDLVKKVNTSDANFVQRLKDPNRKYIQDWAYKNMIATHKLGVGTDEQGNHYIYPEVQEINGKLVDFTRPPYASWVGQVAAEERRDTVRVPSIEDGLLFTENYKKYYPKGKTFDEGKNPEYSLDVIDRAVRYIGQHEGFVDHVYGDRFASQEIAKKHGYWSDEYLKWVLPTAGYGWTAKEDLHSWTEEQANERLAKDIKKYFEALEKRYPMFKDLLPERQIALADLWHLAGPNWEKRMPKLHAALSRGDKDAGKYLSFASHLTKNRNDDRIALWNDPMGYRQKELKRLGKKAAKEKATHVEPVDFTVYKKPILPVERNFDPDVPETISIKNTFASPIEKVIKAIDAKIAVNRILKNLSLEELNPWSSVPQVEDIMAGQVFNRMLTMPQIIGQ